MEYTITKTDRGDWCLREAGSVGSEACSFFSSLTKAITSIKRQTELKGIAKASIIRVTIEWEGGTNEFTN